MSRYVSDWDEMYRAVGDPRDIREDSYTIPLPPVLPKFDHLAAYCIQGAHTERVVKFRFLDELVGLPNGDSISPQRWRLEKAHTLKRKWWCDTCDRTTSWVSRGFR